MSKTTAAQRGKVKILLLAGFLGAGKTTLLRNILSWEKDLSGTVVIVNELGKVPIDGSLLKSSGSDVIELTSGCICCTVREDLIGTLKEVWERFKPERILLEATGVAEPRSVVAVMKDEELSRLMEMQGTITVLDIRFWLARERFGDFFMSQLEQADLILLNKVDTAKEEVVSKALEEIHDTIPESRVVPTTYCEVDPEILWVDGPKRTPARELFSYYIPLKSAEAVQSLEPSERKKGFVAFDFRDDERSFNEKCFKRFLKHVDPHLFRIKGPVRFPDRTLLLNFAGGSGDWEPWDDSPGTMLAFVGWDVDKVGVLKRLRECLKPK